MTKEIFCEDCNHYGFFGGDCCAPQNKKIISKIIKNNFGKFEKTEIIYKRTAEDRNKYNNCKLFSKRTQSFDDELKDFSDCLDYLTNNKII